MFSSSFPIYLFNQYEEEVPVEDESKSDETSTEDEVEEEEAIVEDIEEEEAPGKTKKVVVDDWMHLNAMPPVWLRSVVVIFHEDVANYSQRSQERI